MHVLNEDTIWLISNATRGIKIKFYKNQKRERNQITKKIWKQQQK